MKKKTKKAAKGLGKSVRKAVRRHSLATGVLTGAATAMALSGSGATRKMSEAVGTGAAALLKVGSKRPEMLQGLKGLKKKAGDALVRAGRSLQSDTAAATDVPATDAKVTTTTRRTASTRASA